MTGTPKTKTKKGTSVAPESKSGSTSAKGASVKVKSEPKKQGTCTCRPNSIWSAAVSSVVCVYTVVTRSRAGKPESSMSDAHVHVLSSGLSDADGMHTCTVYLHVHCRTRILSGAGNPLRPHQREICMCHTTVHS